MKGLFYNLAVWRVNAFGTLLLQGEMEKGGGGGRRERERACECV